MKLPWERQTAAELRTAVEPGRAVQRGGGDDMRPPPKDTFWTRERKQGRLNKTLGWQTTPAGDGVRRDMLHPRQPPMVVVLPEASVGVGRLSWTPAAPVGQAARMETWRDNIKGRQWSTSKSVSSPQQQDKVDSSHNVSPTLSAKRLSTHSAPSPTVEGNQAARGGTAAQLPPPPTIPDTVEPGRAGWTSMAVPGHVAKHRTTDVAALSSAGTGGGGSGGWRVPAAPAMLPVRKAPRWESPSERYGRGEPAQVTATIGSGAEVVEREIGNDGEGGALAGIYFGSEEKQRPVLGVRDPALEGGWGGAGAALNRFDSRVSVESYETLGDGDDDEDDDDGEDTDLQDLDSLGMFSGGVSNRSQLQDEIGAAAATAGAAGVVEGSLPGEGADVDDVRRERTRQRKAKKRAAKQGKLVRAGSWKQKYYDPDKKKGLMSTLSTKTLMIVSFDKDEDDAAAAPSGGMLASLKMGVSFKVADKQAGGGKALPDPELPELHWTRDRDVLDGTVHAYAWRVATTGVLGFVCCIVQNELIIAKYPPDHRLVDTFKALCTCLTIMCLVLLYRYYYVNILFQRLKRHISRGTYLNTQVTAWDVMRIRSFWVEVFFCAIHLPPFSTFEMKVETMTSHLMWRGETVGCLWTSLRIYLLWRVYRNFVVSKLPMRHTVSRFTLLTFGSYFVFKKVLSGWQAVFWMSRLWFGLMLISGYWYRCVELNACLFDTSTNDLCEYTDDEMAGALSDRDGRTQPLLSNDLYYQNAIWQMFTASTTVGYGDTTPRTHPGRAIACLFAMSGITITALLTAGLTNALAWTAEEKSALNLCYREKSRGMLIVQAVRILQMWWRRCMAKKRGLSQNEVDELTPESHWQVKKEFSVSQRQVLVEIDDLAGEGLKIEQVHKRLKTTVDLLDAMADYLWDPNRELINGAAPAGASEEVAGGAHVEKGLEQQGTPKGKPIRRLSSTGANGGLPAGLHKLSKSRKEKEKEARQPREAVVHSTKFKDALKATLARLNSMQSALMNPAVLQANKAKIDGRHRRLGGLARNILSPLKGREDHLETSFPESPSQRDFTRSKSDHLTWMKNAIPSSPLAATSLPRSVSENVSVLGSDNGRRMMLKAGSLKDVTGRLASVGSAAGGAPVPESEGTGDSEAMLYVPKWWRRRELIDERLMKISALTCGFGLVGNVLAVAQNEFIIGGASGKSTGMNILKAGNMVCSIAMCGLLLRYYWILALFRSLSNHLDYCVALGDVNFHEAFSSLYLWLEIVVCTIHLPPFVSFPIVSDSLGNVVLYRAETLFCIINTFRFYLIWKVVRDWVLKDLPKRHTVSRYTAVRFGGIFALKKLLNGGSGVVPIASFWFLGVLLSGYWYRSLELTACLFPTTMTGPYWESLLDVGFFQDENATPEIHDSCLNARATTWLVYGNPFEVKNDLYLWNAFWVMFVTSTTVGYGDYTPVTHAGRLVASVSAMTGIVLAAVLTAALCNGVQWTAEEAAAVHLFEREEARRALGPAAASLIGLWWRRKRRKAVSSEFLARVLAARMHFHQIKKAAMVEMEDCVDHSTRVDQLAKQAKYVETACTEIKARVTNAAPTFEFVVDTSLVSLPNQGSTPVAALHSASEGAAPAAVLTSAAPVHGSSLRSSKPPSMLRSQNSFVRGVVSRKQRRDTMLSGNSGLGFIGSDGVAFPLPGASSTAASLTSGGTSFHDAAEGN